jgi:hypothetical protein
MDSVISFHTANRYKINNNLTKKEPLTGEQLRAKLQDMIYKEMRYDLAEMLYLYEAKKSKSPVGFTSPLCLDNNMNE